MSGLKELFNHGFGILLDPHVAAGIVKAGPAISTLCVLFFRIKNVACQIAREGLKRDRHDDPSSLCLLEKRYFETYDHTTVAGLLKIFGCWLCVLACAVPFTLPHVDGRFFHLMLLADQFIVGLGVYAEGYESLPPGTWRYMGTFGAIVECFLWFSHYKQGSEVAIFIHSLMPVILGMSVVPWTLSLYYPNSLPVFISKWVFLLWQGTWFVSLKASSFREFSREDASGYCLAQLLAICFIVLAASVYLSWIVKRGKVKATTTIPFEDRTKGIIDQDDEEEEAYLISV